MSYSRRSFCSVATLASLAIADPAAAIIWQRDAKAPPTAPPQNEMKYVARLRYTLLAVLGGCGIGVTPRHILTAKHAAKGWTPANLRVDIDGERRATETIIMHPDKSVDLAILKLKQPFTKSHSIPLFAGTPNAGDRVWMGGYGMSGPLGTLSLPGAFASGFNRITEVQGHHASIVFNAPGETSETDEVFPAIMDSGSPVFMFRDSRWILSGITITVSNRNHPNYGDHSRHELLASSRDWLDQHIPELGWA